MVLEHLRSSEAPLPHAGRSGDSGRTAVSILADLQQHNFARLELDAAAWTGDGQRRIAGSGSLARAFTELSAVDVPGTFYALRFAAGFVSAPTGRGTPRAEDFALHGAGDPPVRQPERRRIP